MITLEILSPIFVENSIDRIKETSVKGGSARARGIEPAGRIEGAASIKLFTQFGVLKDSSKIHSEFRAASEVPRSTSSKHFPRQELARAQGPGQIQDPSENASSLSISEFAAGSESREASRSAPGSPFLFRS